MDKVTLFTNEAGLWLSEGGLSFYASDRATEGYYIELTTPISNTSIDGYIENPNTEATHFVISGVPVEWGEQ